MKDSSAKTVIVGATVETGKGLSYVVIRRVPAVAVREEAASALPWEVVAQLEPVQEEVKQVEAEPVQEEVKQVEAEPEPLVSSIIIIHISSHH